LRACNDRTQAEVLKGTRLGFVRSASDENIDDETYASDLIGLVVVDERDGIIGTIHDIVNYGASDIAVIETKSGNLDDSLCSRVFPRRPRKWAHTLPDSGNHNCPHYTGAIMTWRVSVITLMPEIYPGPLAHALVGRICKRQGNTGRDRFARIWHWRASESR